MHYGQFSVQFDCILGRFQCSMIAVLTVLIAVWIAYSVVRVFFNAV